MAFARRLIKLHFQLGKGDFGEAGSDTITLENLRCTASISQAGGASSPELDLTVWGMTLDQMNKLTTLNKLAYDEVYQNIVTVEAGDIESGLAVVFQGTINEAWADGRQPADMAFQVLATSGLYSRMKPIPPTSFNGSVDVALALSGIANQMQLGFENSGVSGTLKNPYWPGDLGTQLEQICKAVDCEFAIDEVNGVVAVWPRGQSRGGQSVRIAKDSGLIGYPAFTQNGLQFTTLFNPSIAYALTTGRSINIESAFTPANGSWVVAAVNHKLEANVPGGAWFSDIECGLLGAL